MNAEEMLDRHGLRDLWERSDFDCPPSVSDEVTIKLMVIEAHLAGMRRILDKSAAFQREAEDLWVDAWKTPIGWDRAEPGSDRTIEVEMPECPEGFGKAGA